MTPSVQKYFCPGTPPALRLPSRHSSCSLWFPFLAPLMDSSIPTTQLCPSFITYHCPHPCSPVLSPHLYSDHHSFSNAKPNSGSLKAASSLEFLSSLEWWLLLLYVFCFVFDLFLAKIATNLQVILGFSRLMNVNKVNLLLKFPSPILLSSFFYISSHIHLWN